jgi:hypothetical protein
MNCQFSEVGQSAAVPQQIARRRLTDSHDNRVLKLPAGADAPIELPFAGLNAPSRSQLIAAAASTSPT